MKGSRLVRLGLTLSVLFLAAASPLVALPEIEEGRMGAELPHAPRHEGRFGNLDPEFHRASGWTRVRFYLLGFATVASSAHKFVPLPTAAPDVEALRKNHHAATVTWVGHATLLVQLDGVNLLTDPAWSNRLGPLSGTVGVHRFTPPGIALKDLPPIDVVLISHDHYDHLDEPTVRRLAQAFNPLFAVPLGIKAWLADRGITNVVELDWSESVKVKGLEIVCAPAQHGSGRSLTDGGHRLWASWAVLGRERHFYHGGDTGYSASFKEIGRRFGPFDVVALPIGAYLPPRIMKWVHTTPEQAVQAFVDLDARTMLGMHWGTFDLADEPLDEPPARMLADIARRGIDSSRAWVLKIGETRAW